MPRTYNELVAALGRGDAVRGVKLADPAQRRMFRFLLASQERSQASFSDAYIEALKGAFAADEEQLAGGVPTPHCGEFALPCRWTLHRVEATNVGGVTAYGARPFVLEVQGDSLCLDGHNGQGKTSLASLVMVGLTGHRLGPHGPSAQACVPQQVRDAAGRLTSLTWPPVISYPASFAQLQSAEPEACIRLVFRDQDGREHVTERTIDRKGVRPEEPSLPPGVTPLHVELSVLVPNRVAHVRVNEETRLVEVLAELIGLEPLKALGEHAFNLCHGSKNFVGHPKRAEIDAALRSAKETLELVLETEVARSLLPDLSSPAKAVQQAGLPDALAKAESVLVQRKSELFAGVTVAATLNLSRASDLSRVQQLLSKADDLLVEDGEALLRSLPAMAPVKKVAFLARPEPLASARRAVADARASLEAARIALERQRHDGRLRLKAVAAVWHRENHPDAESVEDCPLCTRGLSGAPDLEALAGELARLRSEGDAVTRSFGEVCEGIAHRLTVEFAELGVTEGLPIDPVGDLLRELSESLETNEALGLILVEARRAAVEAIRDLDSERRPASPPPGEAPSAAEEHPVAAALARAEQAIALAEAWPEAKDLLGRVREEVLGKAAEPACSSRVTLRCALEAVQRVSNQAAPLDEALDRLMRARSAHKAWRDLQDERTAREQIASAIAPLKGLVRLVEEEVRETLADVTDGTVKLFERIYAGGPLALQGAAFDRRSTLQVEGRVGEVLVDASHIANTSWLRAFLWAFAFTLRRQAVERLEHNPMPLLLLDDPQATFDNCNERQWAALLAEMSAECDGRPAEAQLLVTSYDPKLFERHEFKGDYVGNRGAVCGIDPNTGVLRVFRGDLHRRAWDKFERDPRPETAQDYISEVRLVIEGKLSLILHVFGGHPGTTELEKLRQAFEKQKDLPFFRTSEVQAISNMLRTDKRFRDNLNASHHEADRRTLNRETTRKV